jgi:predicted PurR-regulated permease PerM
MENITPALQGVNIDISQQIPNLTNQFLGLASNVFSNTIFIISTLFFGFYFTLQENLLKGILARFFSAEKIRQVTAIVEKAEVRMSAWVWGEITLMTIVGVMTFVGLSLIGIRYALPLAVLAGLLEAVPNLGPTLSAIPAALIGFSQSYFMGFATIALFFIVQQVENNVVVPIVMKRAVGLNPIVTLIALIIGGKLAGIIGVLLAIPVTLFIETVLVEILKHQEPISPVEQPIR